MDDGCFLVASMSSRMKKSTVTTMPSLTPASNPIPSLPDELMLAWLARVSRFHYPSLSLVSKRLRSLISSPELYRTRSLLRRTESCLYVCLRDTGEVDRSRWFTLCRKPDRFLTGTSEGNMSTGNLMVPISSPRVDLASTSGGVAVGSNIYVIGGPIGGQRYSTGVSILDCRSHKWSEAPSMMVKRNCPSAAVVDGKIYVGGGTDEDDDSDIWNCVEVFDPITRIWDTVPTPNWKQKRSYYAVRNANGIDGIAAGIDGKFHLVFRHNGMAYDPKESRWDFVEDEMVAQKSTSSCVIGDVLYCFFHGELKWYDSMVRSWKTLIGLAGLPRLGSHSLVALVDYGGKMAVLWENISPTGDETTLWCAEIALERRYEDEMGGDEMRGKVEWVDDVLTTSFSQMMMKVVVVTL